MPRPLLDACCRCYSLKTGTIISGILGIILSIITIILIYVVRAEFKTILLPDIFTQEVVKIILVVNLCMTILISIFMIIGALKRNWMLMAPWVILGIMLVIGLIISIIWTAVVFFIDGHVYSGVLWLVLGLLCCLIYFYMWSVVYSYFIIIKEENEKGRYSRQPYRR